jgi:hypothetical protein
VKENEAADERRKVWEMAACAALSGAIGPLGRVYASQTASEIADEMLAQWETRWAAAEGRGFFKQVAGEAIASADCKAGCQEHRTCREKSQPPNPETLTASGVDYFLTELRALRDHEPAGELRSAYNDACDRLDVLVSKIRGAAQPKQPEQAPSGYEFTGEYRIPEIGEWFEENGYDVRVVSAPDGEKARDSARWILRKLPTIESVYGEPLEQLKPPEGFEFSGEFRDPREGDTFLSLHEMGALTAGKDWPVPRLILRRIEQPNPPKPEKATDQILANIQQGRKCRECKAFAPIMFMDAFGKPGVCEACYERLHPRPPEPITVESIYGAPLASLQPPAGWTLGEFRKPKFGERFLSRKRLLPTRYDGGAWTGGPRLILEPVKADAPKRRWVFETICRIPAGQQVPAESRYIALGSKSIGYTISGFKADVPVDILRLVERPE